MVALTGAGTAVLLALASVALIMVPVLTGPADVAAAVGIGGALVVATVGAVRARRPPALRAVLVADVLYLCALAGGVAVWPLPAVVALGVLWVAGHRYPALRPVAGWLTRGRMTRELPWLVAAVMVLSAGVLVSYTVLADPPASPFLTWLRTQPVGLVVLGIVAAALLNSAGEEALFRGVLLSELARLWPVVPAVVATSVAFGVAHWAGYPTGPVGVALAAVYGLALGALRVRSRGILAPFAAHVGADVTIFSMAAFVLV